MTPMPTGTEAVNLAVGLVVFGVGFFAPGGGWISTAGAGWDGHVGLTDVDQVPEYLDQRPPRAP